jgi:hypothetical protein
VKPLSRVRIHDDGIGYRRAPAQHPAHTGGNRHQGYVRTAQVPNKMRHIAKPLHHQTEEIGMIETGLQYVGAHLAKHAGEPKQTEWARHASPHAERYKLDPRHLENRPNGPGVGYAHDYRPEPVSIGTRDEARQHPLGASGLKTGDEVDNGDHK